MSKQTINVGTAANSGNGDPFRTAFLKANANFDELYAANDSLADEVADKASAASVTAAQAAADAAASDAADAAAAVTAEASARAAAITSAVSAEATARDTAITTAVAAEATARTNADALKAPLASPTFTGTPAAPTASAGTNTTQVATTAFVRGEVAALVGAAPGALDTLAELSAALGADANFSATTATALAALAARATALEVARTRVARVTVDQLAIGITYADVTGLSFSMEANTTYDFEFILYADSDAQTTGIDVAVNGPASPTALNYVQGRYSTTQFYVETVATTYDNDTASTGVATTATRIFRVKGIVSNGANAGNLTARIKRENAGSGPNVRAGSFGRITKLF